MKNEYDAEKHEYKIDGVCVPSVTELLPVQNFFVSPERLEETRQQGQDNHDKIRLYYDSGCQTFGDPFIEEYHALIEEHKAGFGFLMFNEKILFSERYKFAGTPDTVYERALIDLKRTKGDEKIHALQLAGYSLLLQENGYGKIKKWFIIYGLNGKLKIKNVFNPQAEQIFLALRKRYDLNQIVETYLKN